MVHIGAYLRQNLEVSRELCDVPRNPKKFVKLDISLTGLSRTGVSNAWYATTLKVARELLPYFINNQHDKMQF